MFSEPARSPYDWQFVLAGFRVRVTWLFWVVSAAWGYDWARGLDREYQLLDLASPGPFSLLLVWVGVSFLSILIHELGHALAMRWYGQASYIVLYHFGGIAIPDWMAGRRGRRGDRWEKVVISAAGPLLQLALGLLVAGVAGGMGFSIGQAGYLLRWAIPLPDGALPNNALTMGLIEASVLTSVFWALLNLVPVLPMDGGHIAQQLIGYFQQSDGYRETVVFSLAVGTVIAIWGYSQQLPTIGLFFMVLAILNFQSLQDPFGTR
jgi:Zn-dependent protease